MTFSVEPTNRCNLACNECPTGNQTLSRPTGNISKQLYNHVIDEIKSYAVWLQLFFQGEPFLHPDITNMIKYANKRKIYTSISTNGHFLNKETCNKLIDNGLNRLIISLDGASEAVYTKYRRKGDFNKVIGGIKNLVETKNKKNRKNPYIIIQFLVFRHNEHQIKEIKKIGKKLGVNRVNIKTAQIYHYHSKRNLIPVKKKHSRYIHSDDQIITRKKKIKNHCIRLWLSSVITNDGSMVPCCYDKSANYIMGNAGINELSNTWNNNAYQNFRKIVLTDRKNIPMCLNCNE